MIAFCREKQVRGDWNIQMDDPQLQACGYDDKKGRSEALLLSFEDDEEGAGFADNTEENGLTWLHIL